jgi:ABC-type antimicrobial peptide transport system permease subunit
MKTQRQQIAETISVPRTMTLLMAGSGVVALLLACVGLYGIVSYDAARRTNEIGIRMALGAQRSDVFRLVTRQTLISVMMGAAAGMALVLAASRLIESHLFGVRPTDPLTMSSVAVPSSPPRDGTVSNRKPATGRSRPWRSLAS